MKNRKEKLNKLVHKWFDKSKEDLLFSEIGLEHGAAPWTITFHCQQALEKYLKGIRLNIGKKLVKSHDLSELSKEIQLNTNPETGTWLDKITAYYIEGRYPLELDEGITMQEAQKVFKKTKELLKIIQAHAKSVKNLDI